MALTAEQETAVHKWLGATPMWRQINPAIRNALLALRNFADANLDAAIVAELTALDTIDAQLMDANRRQKFTKVEEITFANGAELVALRGQGRMHVQRLANLLGVSVVRDVFAAGIAGISGGVMRHG